MAVWSIGLVIYPPNQFLLDQRIRMTPGLPPFDWWLDLPVEVLLKVYVFNVTNSEEFLSGTDNKLKLNEIGPIVYREKIKHTNPIFNENGTFTYTVNRTAVFLPELNTVDRNATLIMPNLPVLFIPTYFFDSPFITKFGINLMMRTLKSSPFVTTTIQNYLWNQTDPILDVSEKLAPSLVPTKNVGILHTIYANFEDNVTVYIGPDFDHKEFFLIDKFDGSTQIPNRDDCRDKVADSSEGTSYPQYLTRNDTVKYWRKTLCKVANLHYTNDEERYGVTAYRYGLSSTTYNRTFPAENDCYKGIPVFPDGLADVSPCYYDTPIAASFPHYLYADDSVKNYVEGLSPNESKHGSYVIIEPNTGIPLHGVARSQINLAIKDMRGYNAKIQRFSNISIPLIWLEYNQVGIPSYIQLMIYFLVVLVPVLQIVFSVCLFLFGSVLIYWYTRRKILTKDEALNFESELFLKS